MGFPLSVTGTDALVLNAEILILECEVAAKQSRCCSNDRQAAS